MLLTGTFDNFIIIPERDHWLPFLPPSHIRFVIVSKALSLKFIPSGTIRKFSASPLNSGKPGKCRIKRLPEAATFTHSF